MGGDKHWQSVVKRFNPPILAFLARLNGAAPVLMRMDLFSSPSGTWEDLSCKLPTVRKGHLLPLEWEGLEHEPWTGETLDQIQGHGL